MPPQDCTLKRLLRFPTNEIGLQNVSAVETQMVTGDIWTTPIGFRFPQSSLWIHNPFLVLLCFRRLQSTLLYACANSGRGAVGGEGDEKLLSHAVTQLMHHK
jgi:hypothetical protein